jgi:hypothetical protein
VQQHHGRRRARKLAKKVTNTFNLNITRLQCPFSDVMRIATKTGMQFHVLWEKYFDFPLVFLVVISPLSLSLAACV